MFGFLKGAKRVGGTRNPDLADVAISERAKDAAERIRPAKDTAAKVGGIPGNRTRQSGPRVRGAFGRMQRFKVWGVR